MKKRVADIIMEILLQNNISDCFIVVGGGAMHLNNALALNKNIDKYFNHHEQACAMAAEAYARISGKMAAVCVTSGPGGTNTLTGVMGAWQDSLPLLVISGQVRYETTIETSGVNLRYRGSQEFDIVNSIGNMTKYAVMVKDPLSIKRELQKAIGIAISGRRGPVWLDIPLNIQGAIVEEDDLYEVEKDVVKLPEVSENEIEELFEIIKKAKRPCILAGNGITNSGNLQKFREFAAILQVPVIAAAIAGDVMYYDNPLFYGISGSIGPRTGNFIVQNADVIVSIGCSLGYKMTGFAQELFAPKAYIVSVEVDENEVKKPGVRVNKLIHTDLTSFFVTANKLAQKIGVSEDWLNYCNKLKSKFSPFEPAENLDPYERVCSYYFWREYEKYEPADSISVLGNNTANSAKLQIGVRKKDQRLVANNNCGSMGADLPETIGAAVATKKTVICLTGDGSIMMNLQELQTIKQYNFPVKLVVFTNDGYNAIRQTCKNFFNSVYIGCSEDSGLSFPDFSKVADTFGFKYNCCNNNREVDSSLEWLFNEDGLVLLEVKQRLDDPVNPKVMSRMNEDGTMTTPALHDMYPFLSKEELDSLMFW
jgi:acetolactate synthase-1/2/3 large subunit